MTHPRMRPPGKRQNPWTGVQVGRAEAESQGLLAGRPGCPEEGALPGLVPTGPCLPQVPNLLEPVRTGVAGSELGAVRGPGPGRGRAAEASPLPAGRPDFLPPPSQLIPLQAPLKTMLQIGVMPMLNGRAGDGREERERRGELGGPRLSRLLPPAERLWRGVQIPLPEGINFVREVVTDHAVSGGGERVMEKEGRAFSPRSLHGPDPRLLPDPSPSLSDCRSHFNLPPDFSNPLHGPCPHLVTPFLEPILTAELRGRLLQEALPDPHRPCSCSPSLTPFTGVRTSLLLPSH